MEERIYLAAKTKPQPPRTVIGGAAAGPAPSNGGVPAIQQASKGQAFAGKRLNYQKKPPKSRRSRRSCCCTFCLWFTLTVVALVLFVAIAGAVLYVLYHPHRPSFSVTSLSLSAFNVSSPGDSLTSRIDVSITAHNSNSKIAFVYDAISVSVSTGGVDVGDGSFPAFTQGTKNTTVLTTVLSSSGEILDSATASDLRKSNNLPLNIKLDTNAGVKIGSLKTKKIQIQVTCSGINASVPKGKTAAAAVSTDAICKVRIHVKIWKWTI